MSFALTEGVRLAPHTTLEVGGPAAFYAEASTEDEAREALAFAGSRGLPAFVLGGGSNVLIADRGFEGLVLRPRLLGIATEALASDEVRVTSGAGEPWDALVARSVDEGLAGLECLSGIPGEVGGVPVQNVGAYGQEVAETLEWVRALSIAGGEAVHLPAAELRFGYRTSRLKHDDAGRWLVTRVAFRLRRGPAKSPRYAELAARAGREPSLASLRRSVLDLRREKSMVHDRLDPNHRSAGSFFTNPVVPVELAAEARARLLAAGRLSEDDVVPTFPDPAGVKLSAGWLIERSGFPRGSGEGRVGLSSRHALALVNRGGATSAELLGFALHVKRGVLAATGVHLAPEPVLVGFEPGEVEELCACAAEPVGPTDAGWTRDR